DRVAAAASRYHLVDLLDIVVRQGRTAVINDEGRLVECQHPDFGGELAGRFECEGRTGGEAVEEGRSAGFVDEGFDIFDLTLHGIRWSVAAIAFAAAVVVEDGEVLRQAL